MTQPTIRITPRKTALLARHDNQLDVLVQIQGPDLPLGTATRRPPLSVALVLDRSGSMTGHPLREAARCARFVLDGLRPTDRASLVTYDNRVDLVVSPRPVTDRAAFDRVLGCLESGGTTNLHGGWRCGAESLLEFSASDSLARVILLSDGCANQGLVDPSKIAEECRALASFGVTTSTYGLGHHFNEDLMVEMARAGQGNHYYGESADDLMDPFREELELLNALCARELELEIEAAEGIRAELLNDYAWVGDRRWRLPDLAYSSEAWALVRLQVPRSKIDPLEQADLSSLLQVRLRYRDLGGMHLSTEPVELSLPTVSETAFASIAEDSTVKSRSTELEVARIQMRARSAAQQGDWGTVEDLLGEIRRLGADNAWIRDVEAELRALSRRRDTAMFAKETRYSAMRMGTRLAAPAECAADQVDLETPAFLRRKSAQGKRRSRRAPAGR